MNGNEKDWFAMNALAIAMDPLADDDTAKATLRAVETGDGWYIERDDSAKGRYKQCGCRCPNCGTRCQTDLGYIIIPGRIVALVRAYLATKAKAPKRCVVCKGYGGDEDEDDKEVRLRPCVACGGVDGFEEYAEMIRKAAKKTPALRLPIKRHRGAAQA